MNRRLTTLLVALMLLLTAALPTTILGRAPAAPFTKGGIFIVQLAELPVVAYDGSIKGLRATKPADGAKIDPTATDVVRYVGYLNGRHNGELNAAGGGQKLYDYAYSFNGFAAKLSAAAANKLAADPDVLAITPNELVETDTSFTPDFLGLTAPGGLWDQLGGQGSGGEDVVIGIIDSGVWPESLSFADRENALGIPSAQGTKVYSQLQASAFHGKCASADDPGSESWDANLCNRKLVAARYYNAAWGGNAGMTAQRPWEFNSPRDYNGHGTHTSSTAGGNYGTPTTGAALQVADSISGMAPRARIATYKVLWSTQDASLASGQTADIVQAIDQAVADGVDVINYSISGTTTNFLDPVQVSFLFAADAGVFVSASAGNSGPTTGTVAHPGPWLTTVAAGTHPRNGNGSVTLGDGTQYFGASLATAVGPSPLIDSNEAGAAGASVTAVTLCFSTFTNGGTPALDPAKVAGKIVVCDRGTNARTDKSLAVKQAGGVGMILLNPTANSLNADFHFVPTVHLQNTDKPAIDAYTSSAGDAATASIAAAVLTFSDPAPLTAAFSSRGPLTAGGGDLLKPDVIAPGQDILAAVAPPGAAGFDFNLLSGTSMSAPHVAGLAALLQDRHPTWSPMAIKSALMTTGYDVIDASLSTATRIFRQGAGHVRPNSAADPGLVYDHGFLDWLAFLCGSTTGVSPATCTALAGLGYSFDASDLNVPSIAIGNLAGVQTVHRTVTNVDDASATYNASVAAPAGITVEVSPSSLTLDPGESGDFTVTFTRTTAALNAYVGGQLTWTDGTHSVRSPLVIRPVALAAPASVSGNGGPINYNVTFGYTGTFNALARGLVPATTFVDTVTDDPTDNFNTATPDANQGIKVFDVAVPAGTTLARFSLFDNFTDGADDLDLYVYRVNADLTKTFVGISGGGTSAEEVNLANPTAATYKVYVHAFATEGPDANFTLFTWVLGSTDAGNMTVSAPASAVTGATGAINLTFSGLAPATKYLGSVAYNDGVNPIGTTIVRVDTP